MEYKNRFDLFEHENERFSERRIIYAAANVTREDTYIHHDRIDRYDASTNRPRMPGSTRTHDYLK